MNDRQIAQLIETALGHHREGRLQEAERCYQRVLEQRPSQPDALHLLGVIAHQCGNHTAAVDLIMAALKVAPKLHAGWNNLGEALRALGRHNEAVIAYRNAIAAKPDFAEAIGNLARCHDAMGNRKDSIDTWQRFIRLDPRNIDAYHALATALHTVGQEQQAVACWEKLLSLDPTFYRAHNDIGVVLGQRYFFEKAEKHFFESIRIAPEYAVAYYNLGVIYERQARYADAIHRYEQSIAIDPTAPDPQLNLSLLTLLMGDLPGGLKRYEWRWKLPRVVPLIKPFTQPEWRGEDVAGKTVLIHAEQGMGDTIQFARYCKTVKARGARVLFMVQPPLMSLLKQVDGVDEVVSENDLASTPPFDVHIPTLSLPLVLGTTIDTVPADVPYLRADPERVARARQNMAADTNFRIGITWAGRPEHHNDHNRSTELQQFATLAAVPGVTFYSLQKGSAALSNHKQLPANMKMVDCDKALSDFSDSAALLENLDLVISVDTSVVHLAGAMGKEVWTLLPLVPDWRWLVDRPDTPWYPTMRLFRQTRLKNWQDVFDQVAAELAKKVAARARVADPSGVA